MDDKFYLTVIDKFNSSTAAELEFTDGNTRLLLRKDGAFRQNGGYPLPQDHSVHLGISAHTADTAAAGKSSGGEKITSPIVATFYSSPGPDAPPFVKTGTKIKAGQTLCILEAMKMMNHLEAEYDCEITEIHAANGDLVEYGQELFTVKRN